MNYTNNPQSLIDILTYQRPARSAGEELFINKWLDGIYPMAKDVHGNRYLRIPKPSGDPSKTMFSCHTDTVHPRPNHNYRQKIEAYVNDEGRVLVSAEGKQQLGADDGAGIWLMLNMIQAKIPGLYVFHRDEETGGQGSTYIAQHQPDIVEGIDVCIAFDRQDCHDLITHQLGRCASDGFCEQFAKALNDTGLVHYQLDPTGVFTDSANYTHIISECTNISVGYAHQHTFNEYLDINHTIQLRDALLKIDFEALEAKRDPNELDLDDPYNCYMWGEDLMTRESTSMRELYDFVVENPAIVASFLEDFGVDKEDLELYGEF